MKILVIAEKPDMGRNIARVIEPKATYHRTHFIGERYIISWAVGHLVSLAEPDKYDPKYKKWRFEHLPIVPEKFKLVAYTKTKKQLSIIGDLAKQCDRLINACDAGREGQYIFSLIQRYLRLKQPVQRLWISDLTPETIRSGFSHLRDGAEFDNLTTAARARSEADWIIGMNGSRAFTTKHHVLLSVGRVQTPVLALIYDREKEIADFSSQHYYEVRAHFTQERSVYHGIWQGNRITDKRQAEAIAAQTAGQPAKITKYDKKNSKEYPNKLYDLTLLQREANAKFGFSAKRTLDIAQSLYEKHKLISYPRTNSNYVTEQNIPEMHRVLESLRGSSYDSLVRDADKKRVHIKNRAVCNPGKVEDHHAILPTLEKPGQCSDDEKKIYDLIVRRMLSHYYPPAEYLNHTLWTEVLEHTFKTTVKEQQQAGWKRVYENESSVKKHPSPKKQYDNEEEQTDAPFIIQPAQPVKCDHSEALKKETKPPKSFTEGTLLRAMESAGKQIEDESLREAMKDAGLGTPATRASTIERLKQVGYIEMKGKQIRISAKGKATIEAIRASGISLLTSPEMTGAWEKRLNAIAKGVASETVFMDKVKLFADNIIDKLREQPAAPAMRFENHSTSQKGKRARSRSAAASGGIAACPRENCDGQIITGRKGYGCTHYKSGCTFVIWKNSFGKALTESMVSSLIQEGKTNRLKFKSKAGKPYQAKIKLADPNTGAVELEF